MSTSTPTKQDSLSRREELSVSAAAVSGAPWGAAAVTGAVVTGADVALHVLGGHLGLSPSLSAGAVVFFAVAAGGALWRNQSGRAISWARRNPWRFAMLPGLGAAAVVFVLSVVLGGSGLFGAAFTAIWHGLIAYGLTGAAGSLRRRSPRAIR
jgi:hypothetical protein